MRSRFLGNSLWRIWLNESFALECMHITVWRSSDAMGLDTTMSMACNGTTKAALQQSKSYNHRLEVAHHQIDFLSIELNLLTSAKSISGYQSFSHAIALLLD